MLKILKQKFTGFFRRLSGREQIMQLKQLQQQLQVQLQLQQQLLQQHHQQQQQYQRQIQQQLQQQHKHQLQHQLQQHRQLHQHLLLLGNSLEYSLAGREAVKDTAEYKRCSQIVSLFSPMDIAGAAYARFGGSCDGGYVMVDGFQRAHKAEAAYSFGIGTDISWDESIASCGIDVFMYDHTTGRPAKDHPKFHYYKTGVTGFAKGESLKTVGELIAENGHAKCKNLIMKMDIEGCEWDVFKEVPEDILARFSQVVVEFHGLLPAAYGSGYDMIIDALKKINLTHQSVHVHANNYDVPLWIGGLVLPTALEVTYVRRADFKDKFVANTRQFPTSIDYPNWPGLPDIYLSNFSAKK